MECMDLVIAAVIITAALFLLSRVVLPRLLAWRGVTMRKTRFGIALVFDSEDADGTPVRLLNVNGTFQSVTYLSDDLWCELACMYHRTFSDVLDAIPQRRHALVIGGGGYSFPKYLLMHDKQVRVDVVEIDPAITEIARESFFLDRLERTEGVPGRLDLVCADGWAYLEGTVEPYDLVVNDAFSGNRPLGPMGTEQGARVIHQHLSPGGLYLANIRSELEGGKSRRLISTLDTFAGEFAHVYLIPECPEEPGRLGNNVMAACDEELPVGGEWDGKLRLN